MYICACTWFIYIYDSTKPRLFSVNCNSSLLVCIVNISDQIFVVRYFVELKFKQLPECENPSAALSVVLHHIHHIHLLCSEQLTITPQPRPVPVWQRNTGIWSTRLQRVLRHVSAVPFCYSWLNLSGIRKVDICTTRINLCTTYADNACLGVLVQLQLREPNVWFATYFEAVKRTLRPLPSTTWHLFISHAISCTLTPLQWAQAMWSKRSVASWVRRKHASQIDHAREP